MELTGTVKKLGDVQTFGSGFQKREMVLLTQEQYPQPINIEFTQDKISLLDALSEGDEVRVSINIRGREWTSPQGEVKYFNSITGWRLEKTGSQGADPAPVQRASAAPAATNENVFGDEEDDDLPF